MAQLKLTFFANPVVPTAEYVRVIAWRRSNMAIEAANEIFPGPHPMNRVVSVYVPSPETHFVAVYRTPSPDVLGVLVNSYDAMPNFYNSVFLADLEIVVGRGEKEDPENPGVIIDPVAGTKIVEIPYLSGKEVARIYRSSISRPMAEGEYALTTTGGDPCIRLLGEDDTFYAGELGGEIIRIVFAPYYENNTGQAIFDLNKMITDHMSDTNNPHAVTKAQVGLGALPNAISNSYQLNDPASVASSKAVHDLWLSANNSKIISIGSIFPGNIGAVSIGGAITAVENAAGVESKVTVTHGLGIIGNYTVFPMVQGRSSGSSGGFPNWSNDNETLAVVGDTFTANTFQLFFRKLGTVVTSIKCFYIIMKLPD